jgi:hypothetical protein
MSTERKWFILTLLSGDTMDAFIGLTSLLILFLWFLIYKTIRIYLYGKYIYILNVVAVVLYFFYFFFKYSLDFFASFFLTFVIHTFLLLIAVFVVNFFLFREKRNHKIS